MQTLRTALLEHTRQRVPLAWAMTQSNLGNALRTLGEREGGTVGLKSRRRRSGKRKRSSRESNRPSASNRFRKALQGLRSSSKLGAVRTEREVGPVSRVSGSTRMGPMRGG